VPCDDGRAFKMGREAIWDSWLLLIVSLSEWTFNITDGSATTAPKVDGNTGLIADVKKRLREELEVEARLGSAPPSQTESNAEWLAADGSEMPPPDLSKTEHEVRNNILYRA
jgi:hypothetical protein